MGEKRLRLLYKTFPIKWNSAKLDSLLVTASNTTLELPASAPVQFRTVLPDLTLPFPFLPSFLQALLSRGSSTIQANWSAMIALRISPFDDSTMMSKRSFGGCFCVFCCETEVPAPEKWRDKRAWRAFRSNVGAIGLNLICCMEGVLC